MNRDEIRRALRPRRSILPDLKDVLPKEKPPPKTAAERMRDYRARLKASDDYKEHRKQETTRVKDYRKRMNDETKQHNKDRHAEYMRSYRLSNNATAAEPGTSASDRGKTVHAAPTVQVKKLTRNEKKMRASKWKDEKRTYRSNLTRAQRDASNARRRDKYALKRAQTLLETLLPNGAAPPLPRPINPDNDPVPGVSNQGIEVNAMEDIVEIHYEYDPSMDAESKPLQMNAHAMDATPAGPDPPLIDLDSTGPDRPPTDATTTDPPPIEVVRPLMAVTPTGPDHPLMDETPIGPDPPPMGATPAGPAPPPTDTTSKLPSLGSETPSIQIPTDDKIGKVPASLLDDLPQTSNNSVGDRIGMATSLVSEDTPQTPRNIESRTPRVKSGFKSSEARRSAAYRARRNLPTSPSKFVDCIQHLIKNSTPRKKAALSTRIRLVSPPSKRKLNDLEKTSMKCFFTSISRKRSNKVNYMRRLAFVALLRQTENRASTRAMKKTFSFSSRFVRRGQRLQEHRKKRKDALSNEVVSLVLDFFQRGDISREIPNHRLAGKRVLEASMTALLDQFRTEHPGLKISRSKFFSLRPKTVLTQDQMQLMQCLCEYCINIDFKLKSLSQKLSASGAKEIANSISHKYALSYATLCPRENNEPYHKKTCIDRQCNLCGTRILEEKLAPFAQSHGESSMKWKVWLTEEYVKKGKDGNETMAKHMVMKEKETSVNNFLAELFKDLDPFSKHLFNAKWQAQQFEELKKNLPPSWVMFCMDFGENYNCHFQDEAQSAHWSYNQATIHPIVAYYNCTEPDCNEVVHESIVFISNDRKHDQHAVQHFVTLANQHLTSRGVDIKHQVHFTDGSPTQYKSKLNFCDASLGEEDFGFVIEKNFFGSRHGKGPCDGEIGVVKKNALAAVKSRQKIISDANDLFKFGKESLTLPKQDGEHVHARREFFFVKEGQIERNRKERGSCKAVPGTRSLHAVRGIRRHVVQSRGLSCFCEACVSAATDSDSTPPCPNVRFTGEWEEVALKKAAEKGSPALKRNKKKSAPKGKKRAVTECKTRQSIDSDNKAIAEPEVPVGLTHKTSQQQCTSENEPSTSQEATSSATMPMATSEPDTEVSTTSEPTNIHLVKDFEEMQFYAVYYSKPSKFYIGRLEKAPKDSEIIEFNYLARTPARNHFYWKKRREVEKENRNYVFHGPIQLKGHHEFSLEEDELAKINAKFNELKKIGLR